MRPAERTAERCLASGPTAEAPRAISWVPRAPSLWLCQLLHDCGATAAQMDRLEARSLAQQTAPLEDADELGDDALACGGLDQDSSQEANHGPPMIWKMVSQMCQHMKVL